MAASVATRESCAYLKHVSKYAAGFPLDEEYYEELRDAGRIR
jgi:hypothetical protein